MFVSLLLNEIPYLTLCYHGYTFVFLFSLFIIVVTQVLLYFKYLNIAENSLFFLILMYDI